MDSSLYSRSSINRFSRPSYGKIAYSPLGFSLKTNEEIENYLVSRSRVDVSKEPLFTVEDISHEWMDSSKDESNEDDMNSKETSLYEDESEEAPFCSGTPEDQLPESIIDPKKAIDEHCKIAEEIEKESWIFCETLNHQTQSSHSSTESMTTNDLLKNLEKPVLLPPRSFNLKTIDLKKLDIANEFWTQTKLPLNVTNSTRNSFVIDRRFRQTKQCKLTKSTFENIFVINQVDRKFICCIVEEDQKRLLLLIDQHAAHERVCLEKLMRSKSSYV